MQSSKPSDAEKVLDQPNSVITESRQLTFTGPRSGEGYFSADGKKMIFQSERSPGNPFYQMYVMDLQSGAMTRLSPGQGKTTCGWIHPNLKKALWSSTHLDKATQKKQVAEYAERKKPVKGKYSWSFDEYFDIFESDLQGKSQKRLTKDLGYEAEASYSPDGQWIAYASNAHAYKEKLSEAEKKLFDQDPSSQMEIYLMKANGEQKKRLTRSLGYDGGPFFSADGKKITWRRFSETGATAEIYTMNVDGSEPTQITRLNAMSWAPFFHPSGDYIIFASSLVGYSNFELYIVDSLGKNKPVRVTFDEGFDGLSTFDPTGSKVTWTHRNEKGESQIMIARWDDAQARKLLALPSRAPAPFEFQNDILAEDARRVIRYLASDDLEGRATGGKHEKKYTDHFVELFKAWGLVGGAPNGGFVHEFEFVSGVSLGANNKLQILNRAEPAQLKLSEDYIPLSFSASGKTAPSGAVFVGYGLKVPATEKTVAYDSYKNIDVKGKWVLVLRDFPDEASPELKQQMLSLSRIQHKITVAKNEGALGIIFLNGLKHQIPENLNLLKFEGSLSDNSIPVLKLKSSLAEAWLASQSRSLKEFESPQKPNEVVEGFEINALKLTAEVDLQTQKSRGLNVIARLPAKSSGLARGAVLLGAHADHLGRGEMGSSLARSPEQGAIHSGADDNASGVAGVLELAHYFSGLKKKSPQSLKKDLFFALWSGEEIGLLGSSQFVKDWDLKQKQKFANYFQAGLNMDMVGRYRDRLYIQGVGSADHWVPLIEETGLKTALPLSLQSDPYLPTDSMAIYLGQVPSISFFTGAHSEYHSPRDQESLINYEGLERVIRFVGSLTQTLADSQVKMLAYQKVESKVLGRGNGRTFRLYLGTIPDYSQEGVKGVRISGVSKDSPAEKAGLKDKDVIVEFSGSKIENIYDYVYSLQTVRPDQETTIKVKRGELVQELKIVPQIKE